jgi:hypothetical protein
LLADIPEESAPVGWEVRKRSNPHAAKSTGVVPSRPPSGAHPPKQKKQVLKMSEGTYSGDDFDYANDATKFMEEPSEVGVDRGQAGFLPEGVVNLEVDDVDEVDLRILDKELELLKTKKRSLQKRHNGLHSQLGAVVGECSALGLRGPSASQKASRRQFFRQQALDILQCEQSGRKRYIVDVDLKGNSYSLGHAQWLTCMRGHSMDIDFSKDNYQTIDTGMLLNIKGHVVNTFEYRGGLQRVTEEVFHSTIKSQQKAKRYQMKKLMLDCQEKHYEYDRYNREIKKANS